MTKRILWDSFGTFQRIWEKIILRRSLECSFKTLKIGIRSTPEDWEERVGGDQGDDFEDLTSAVREEIRVLTFAVRE